MTKVETCESTNSALAEQAHNLAPGSVLYTLNQTRGRGRLEREWVTRPGDSLAFSFLVDPPSNSAPLTWLPLLVGHNVAKVVSSLGVQNCVIKWPNDVLVRGQKIAGILIEHDSSGHIVVGVGINLFSQTDTLPDAGATSVVREGGSVGDVYRQIMEPIIAGVLSDFDTSTDDSVAASVQRWSALVTANMSTIGKEIEVHLGHGREVRGIASGLSAEGGLEVICGQGDFITVTAADVFHVQRK